MNVFKNIYARFAMGMFIKNESTNIAIDAVIENIIKNKMIPTSMGQYYLEFGPDIKMWNANKPYAWLNRGRFKKNGLDFSWDNEMPSSYMMLKFKKYLESVVIENI